MPARSLELVWLVPAALIVCLELSVAAALGLKLGFSYTTIFREQAGMASGIAAGGSLVMFLTVLLSYPLKRVESPLRQLALDRHAIAGRALLGSATVFLFALQTCALGWTKSMIPMATGFWADPMLANLDQALFGGDPWKYLYRLLGDQPWIDTIYLSFLPGSWGFMSFATAVIVAFLPASRSKSVLLMTYFLMVMTAMLFGQFALPSAGPIFYKDTGLGDRFAALPIHASSRFAHDYLWNAHLHVMGKVGSGISAFPSLHVADTVWLVLVWRSFHRLLLWPGLLFAGVICVGSVYLGWHYAVDGIAGVAITLFAWFVAERVMRAIEARAALSVQPAAA